MLRHTKSSIAFALILASMATSLVAADVPDEMTIAQNAIAAAEQADADYVSARSDVENQIQSVESQFESLWDEFEEVSGEMSQEDVDACLVLFQEAAAAKQGAVGGAGLADAQNTDAKAALAYAQILFLGNSYSQAATVAAYSYTQNRDAVLQQLSAVIQQLGETIQKMQEAQQKMPPR